MVKLVNDSEELIGKVIKYCNICHGADGNEHNIIATEDGYAIFYNVNYESGDIRCFNEKGFKYAVLSWPYLKNDLINNEIITEDEIKEWKKEVEEQNKLRDQRIKKQKYEEYLKLKKEFEGK